MRLRPRCSQGGEVPRSCAPRSEARTFESFPARHFGTKLGTPKPADFAPDAATSVRRSTPFDPMIRTFFRVRSRSRPARALSAHRWSGSGLPCDHGWHPCQTCATRRYAASDGARNVDFECFLGSNGTRPPNTVPLQCHPKQCAAKHLRPLTVRSDTVAFI